MQENFLLTVFTFCIKGIMAIIGSMALNVTPFSGVGRIVHRT